MSQIAETTSMEQMDAIIDRYGASSQFSLAILQDTQKAYNYLPRWALEYIAERLDISLGEVYRLATFFAAFSLQPKGQYVIKVCLGTACHVHGAPHIVEQLERDLGIDAGGTTPDGKFTLEAVRCLGACALAPVMVINEQVHGKMSVAAASARATSSSWECEAPNTPHTPTSGAVITRASRLIRIRSIACRAPSETGGSPSGSLLHETQSTLTRRSSSQTMSACSLSWSA